MGKDSALIVTLSNEWRERAIATGHARQRWAEQRDAEMFGRKSDDPLGDHIVGCLGEAATAKFLHLPWDRTIGRLDIPDVGGFVETRARRVPGTGTDLIIYPKDGDDSPFVLALVSTDFSASINLVGWLFGHEGKARGQWFARSGIYFAGPQYRGLDELAELTRREVQWRKMKATAAA